MKFIKRNINGILGTIIFHLIIVIIAMASGMKTALQYQETYMLIEPQYFDEIEQEKEKTDAESKYGDIDIEQYINELRNVGSNYRGGASPEELQAMSQEKLKAMYEAEMLREKYGDDYEKMMNTSYKDYLKENSTVDNKTGQSGDDNISHESYAGPALVFVELENPKRGKTYIEVPVFTCRHGGTVIINISIDTDGRVKSANITSVKSSGDGDCIGNAARNAALNSKFTTAAGGKLEYGKITYQFIQQ